MFDVNDGAAELTFGDLLEAVAMILAASCCVLYLGLLAAV